MKYHIKTLYILFKFKRKKNKKLNIIYEAIIDNELLIHVSSTPDYYHNPIHNDFVSLLLHNKYKKKISPWVSFDFQNSNYWLNKFYESQNNPNYYDTINSTILKKNYREILSMFKKYIEAY